MAKTKEKLTMTGLIAAITDEKIYKLMNIITLAVASVFLIKNFLGGEIVGAIAVAACLAVYCISLIIINKSNAKKETKYLIVSCALMVVISIVSIFSGDSFSDDFLLYLAAMAMSGLFLRPNYIQSQLGVADVLFIIQCLCAPQKVGSTSQFIMCLGIFNLVAFLFSMVVARGRSFINENLKRAKEMEEIIQTLAKINGELNHSFDTTQERISDISNTNLQVELRTNELLEDSNNITDGVAETIQTCDNASTHIATCKDQIRSLVENIQHFEAVLKENDGNIQSMSTEIISVRDSSQTTTEVFDEFEKQMGEIVDVVAQLKAIASSTTMLSLNASIEAARAGAAGAGFAVVAEKVQQLAVDSNRCSGQVEHIVADMQIQMDRTRRQMQASTDNVNLSLESLEALNTGFKELLTNFNALYQNIEAQDSSINELANSFEMIEASVSTMAEYSEKNQMSIHGIADSIKVYGSNMEQMEQDTESLKQLAENMEQTIHQ